MHSKKVDVSVSKGFEKTVSTTEEEAADQVRLMAALKMFELGKLSSGHAAQLTGCTQEACGRYRVSVFNYPSEKAGEELRRDMGILRNMLAPE